jgi:hypothetical protein
MPSYRIYVPMPKYELPRHLYRPYVIKCTFKLEKYLNECAKDSPVTVLTYSQIADATRVDKEIVTFLLHPLTGSHSSITINNPNLKDKTIP